MIYTNWQPRFIQLLSVIGIILAFYLVLFHNDQLVSSGCVATEIWDCGAVSGPQAPYSKILDIPVAIIGMVGYSGIFLLVWLADFIIIVRQNLHLLLLGLVGPGFLFTAYLSTLEAVVLEAWCKYCVYSAGIITLMLFLGISYFFSQKRAKNRPA